MEIAEVGLLALGVSVNEVLVVHQSEADAVEPAVAAEDILLDVGIGEEVDD